MNLIDKAVSYFNPKKGIERAYARETLDVIKNGYPNRSKDIETWSSPPDSPDNDILEDLDDLRGKSRSLFMNNEVAGAVLAKIKTSVIGPGLMVKPVINYKYLNIDRDKAKEYERIIKTKFNAWASSVNSDSSRTHDFYTNQALVCLAWVMSGDVFAIPKRVKRKGVDVDLCIQILEADRIKNPSGSNESIKGGVEIDKQGSICKYYITDKHPGDGNVEAKGYPIFNSLGRKNILHIFEPERPGQRRGVPLLAPLISSLKQLGRYQNAELTTAVMNAMIALIIEKNEEPQPRVNSNYSGGGKTNEAQVEPKKSHDINVENATVIEAYKGHTVKEFQTTRPNKNYKDFVETITEGMGARVLIPKEVLMSSFKSSYSAARAALEEAHKRFVVSRKLIEIKFCQPIYEEFILELIRNGEIECPGFFEDEAIRYAFTRCVWIGPNKVSLDPVKDARAAEINLKNKTLTRGMIAMSQGYDFDDIEDEILEEEMKLATIEKQKQNILKGKGV
ncbi:MAG: phage portal protein [Cetobacterium sp.]